MGASRGERERDTEDSESACACDMYNNQYAQYNTCDSTRHQVTCRCRDTENKESGCDKYRDENMKNY